MKLPGMLDRESLDMFHDRYINLTRSEQELKSKAIDEFVLFLQRQSFLNIHSVEKVIKGGSLGKGTAVRGQSDVDLVVYLNGFRGMEHFKSKREEILSDLERKARSYHGDELKILHLTPYCVQCTFQGEDMDILPAINIERVFGNLVTAYKAIASAADRKREAYNYSASLTVYQRNFVSQKDETVKRVIRLVKYWKKTNKVPILSYTVELITIYASMQSNADSTDELFGAVMELLKDVDKLEIAFDKNYKSSMYTSNFQVPYVLDPANPFNDTLAPGGSSDISGAANIILRNAGLTSLPGLRYGETLDQFHDRRIKLNPLEKRSKHEAIDTFVTFLHQQRFLGIHSVAKVIKGGSLGKGTAVQGQSDVDLVVYLNGFSGIDRFKLSRRDIIRDLEQRAKEYHGDCLKVFQTTPFSVRCTFQGEDMDILPAIELVNTQGDLQDAYFTISRAKDWKQEAQNYSASLTTYQIKFVSPQPETVKRVVRLIKFWKKENGVPILSYTVELVTIHAWLTKGFERGYDTLELFKAVMDLLKDAGSLKVAFDYNYNSADYTRNLPGPYVLDPANPFKDTLRVKDTRDISRAAVETLGGPHDTDNNFLMSKKTCDVIKGTCDVIKAVADILHNDNETGDRNPEGSNALDPSNAVKDALISRSTLDMIKGTCDTVKEMAVALHNVGTTEDSGESSQSEGCSVM